MKPLNTAAGAVLALLLAVMIQNYAAGTLGDWFKSKFLNISPSDNATPISPAVAAAVAGAGPLTVTGQIAAMGDAPGSTVGAIAGEAIAGKTPAATVPKGTTGAPLFQR